MAIPRTIAIVAAAGGLVGANGVALAAMSAHRVDVPALATAANMMLITAAAVLGLAALAQASDRPRAWLAAAVLLLIGVTLFAGDISARSLMGGRLFPMAAPLGGSTMIAGWLAAGVAGLLELRRRGR